MFLYLPDFPSKRGATKFNRKDFQLGFDRVSDFEPFGVFPFYTEGDSQVGWGGGGPVTHVRETFRREEAEDEDIDHE